MRNRDTLTLMLLVFCLYVLVSDVYAQGHCTMETITGTYALAIKGGSSIVLSESSDLPLHWNAAVAPAAGIGEWTNRPDGNGDGFFWMMLGSLNGGLNPVSFESKINELNDDCTGMIEYTFSLPGAPPQVNKERFVVLGNGREIRTVSVQGVLTTETWSTTLRRITDDSVPSCGQNMVQGIHVVQCESFEPANPMTPGLPLFSSTSLFHLEISASGDYSGTLYAKFGPGYFEAPVSGNLTVHADCTGDLTLISPALPGQNNISKGVFFDQGREAYILPVTTLGPEPGQSTPVAYALCQATRQTAGPRKPH